MQQWGHAVVIQRIHAAILEQRMQEAGVSWTCWPELGRASVDENPKGPKGPEPKSGGGRIMGQARHGWIGLHSAMTVIGHMTYAHRNESKEK